MVQSLGSPPLYLEELGITSGSLEIDDLSAMSPMLYSRGFFPSTTAALAGSLLAFSVDFKE